MPSSYPYASAVVKALENKLISMDKLNRMIDAENTTEAVKVLAEVGFANSMVIENANDYEKLLSAEFNNVVKFIKEITPNERATNCFFKQFDYHNAKVILKSKIAKMPIDNALFMPCGEIEPDTLTELIVADNYKDLNAHLSVAIDSIYERILNNKFESKYVDIAIDKAMYGDIFAQLKGVSDKSVRRYFEIKVDLLNLETAFRVKRIGIREGEAEELFIPFGSLDISELVKFNELPYENIIEKFRFTQYGEIVRDTVSSINDGKGLVELERIVDDKLFNIFKVNSFDSFSIAPLICYYLSKLTEIKNIRIVLVCLNNKLDKALIKDRLREQYV